MPYTRSLQTLQLIRKGFLLVAILAVVILAVFTSARPKSDAVQIGFLAVGLVMIGIAIIGRAWCSLYIGGRKAAEIVDRGPYPVTRNPLYIFSSIAALGMGLQTRSLVLAGLFLLIAVGVFFATVKKEEAWLRELRHWGRSPSVSCWEGPRAQAGEDDRDLRPPQRRPLETCG